MYHKQATQRLVTTTTTAFISEDRFSLSLGGVVGYLTFTYVIQTSFSR